MDPVILLDIAGLSFAFVFLIIFVFSKNRSNRARYALVVGMIFASLLILQNLLIVSENWTAAKYLFLFSFPLIYAVYPILYIYLNSFKSGGEKIEMHPTHFIISAFVFLSLLIFLFTLDESFQSLILTMNSFQFDISPEIEIYVWIIYLLYYIQFFYFLTILIKLNIATKRDPRFSYESDWIRYIIIGVVISEITFLIAWLLKSEFLLIDIILSDLVIFVFGIIGLKHDELLLELQISKSFEKNPVLSTERKIKSKISKGKKQEIISEIKEIILKEKLYLNPNLKIKNFAKRLHLPEKELSIIINDLIGKNFSSFINEFKINEACILLAEKNTKISDIPFKVGFFSRSAFNYTFKEFKDQTPTKYRNSL